MTQEKPPRLKNKTMAAISAKLGSKRLGPWEKALKAVQDCMDDALESPAVEYCETVPVYVPLASNLGEDNISFTVELRTPDDWDPNMRLHLGFSPGKNEIFSESVKLTKKHLVEGDEQDAIMRKLFVKVRKQLADYFGKDISIICGAI